MTTIVAAAVHQGWLSVQEGVCDSLDCEALQLPRQKTAMPAQCRVPSFGHWSRLIAEAYTDPDMPGKLRNAPCRAVRQCASA